MELIFGAIPSIVNGLGPNAGAAEAVVFAAWARVAGDLLGERTSPLHFFENRLIVAVQDEMWRRHLEDLSPQMLVRINGRFGQSTVRFIEFRVDEAAVIKARKAEVLGSEKTAAHVTPSLIRAAQAIADENLREQFLSAAASYLDKQKKI